MSLFSNFYPPPTAPADPPGLQSYGDVMGERIYDLAPNPRSDHRRWVRARKRRSTRVPALEAFAKMARKLLRDDGTPVDRYQAKEYAESYVETLESIFERPTEDADPPPDDDGSSDPPHSIPVPPLGDVLSVAYMKDPHMMLDFLTTQRLAASAVQRVGRSRPATTAGPVRQHTTSALPKNSNNTALAGFDATAAVSSGTNPLSLGWRRHEATEEYDKLFNPAADFYRADEVPVNPTDLDQGHSWRRLHTTETIRSAAYRTHRESVTLALNAKNPRNLTAAVSEAHDFLDVLEASHNFDDSFYGIISGMLDKYADDTEQKDLLSQIRDNNALKTRRSKTQQQALIDRVRTIVSETYDFAKEVPSLEQVFEAVLPQVSGKPNPYAGYVSTQAKTHLIRKLGQASGRKSIEGAATVIADTYGDYVGQSQAYIASAVTLDRMISDYSSRSARDLVRNKAGFFLWLGRSGDFSGQIEQQLAERIERVSANKLQDSALDHFQRLSYLALSGNPQDSGLATRALTTLLGSEGYRTQVADGLTRARADRKAARGVPPQLRHAPGDSDETSRAKLDAVRGHMQREKIVLGPTTKEMRLTATHQRELKRLENLRMLLERNRDNPLSESADLKGDGKIQKTFEEIGRIFKAKDCPDSVLRSFGKQFYDKAAGDASLENMVGKKTIYNGPLAGSTVISGAVQRVAEHAQAGKQLRDIAVDIFDAQADQQAFREDICKLFVAQEDSAANQDVDDVLQDTQIACSFDGSKLPTVPKKMARAMARLLDVSTYMTSQEIEEAKAQLEKGILDDTALKTLLRQRYTYETIVDYATQYNYLASYAAVTGCLAACFLAYKLVARVKKSLLQTQKKSKELEKYCKAMDSSPVAALAKKFVGAATSLLSLGDGVGASTEAAGRLALELAPQLVRANCLPRRSFISASSAVRSMRDMLVMARKTHTTEKQHAALLEVVKSSLEDVRAYPPMYSLIEAAAKNEGNNLDILRTFEQCCALVYTLNHIQMQDKTETCLSQILVRELRGYYSKTCKDSPVEASVKANARRLLRLAGAGAL